MKLSNLKIGENFKFKNDIWVYTVVDRWPEDRSSGGTSVRFPFGPDKLYIWDYENPEVEKYGKK